MANNFKNPKSFTNASGEAYESFNGEPFNPADKPITKKAREAMQTEQAKTRLREMLKPGCMVRTILNHCSASGMSRSISLVISDKKDGIFKIDYLVARALGYTLDVKRGGLKVSGCGMDMGFHLVYSLGCTLWPEGTKKPHGTRNGEPDSSGGYALEHRWL